MIALIICQENKMCSEEILFKKGLNILSTLKLKLAKEENFVKMFIILFLNPESLCQHKYKYQIKSNICLQY